MGSRGYVFRYPLEPNDRGDRWVLGGTKKRTHLIKSTNIKARYVFRYPLEPNDRCDRWVLGGTEKHTPWNPSVPHISGPMLQKPMISMSGPARPLRFGVQTPSNPHDRCDHGVLGGTEKRTPWNPSVPQISGPMLQNPMISMSGPAGPLRFGVQTPSKPNDRCDRWVLGGTEKRTPWNPSVPHISGPCFKSQ